MGHGARYPLHLHHPPPVVQYSSPSAHPVFYPVSFPTPDCSLFPPGLLYLDLNIYRESMIKFLIREQSEDLYRLIKKVHFDGKYYRVECVRSGEWEHCWDLANPGTVFRNDAGFSL